MPQPYNIPASLPQYEIFKPKPIVGAYRIGGDSYMTITEPAPTPEQAANTEALLGWVWVPAEHLPFKTPK